MVVPYNYLLQKQGGRKDEVSFVFFYDGIL